MKYEYLLFNLIIAAAPIIGIALYPNAKRLSKKSMPAIVLPAALFIAIDQLVTGYFWTFNPTYNLGITIGRLPIEEILFFFTVPTACLFLWENLKPYIQAKSTPKHLKTFLNIIFVAWLSYALVKGQLYTAIITASSLIVMTLKIFNSTKIWKFLLVILPLTLLFNGYLTARPVVVYNSGQKSNINFAKIPIEDILYGWLLIALACSIYESRASK